MEIDVAHKLARHGFGISKAIIWVEESPVFVQHLLFDDANFINERNLFFL